MTHTEVCFKEPTQDYHQTLPNVYLAKTSPYTVHLSAILSQCLPFAFDLPAEVRNMVHTIVLTLTVPVHSQVYWLKPSEASTSSERSKFLIRPDIDWQRNHSHHVPGTLYTPRH